MEKDNLSPKQDLNSIKLVRGQRGSYGWEIKIVSEDENDIIKRLNKVDVELSKTYDNLNLKEVR